MAQLSPNLSTAGVQSAPAFSPVHQMAMTPPQEPECDPANSACTSPAKPDRPAADKPDGIVYHVKGQIVTTLVEKAGSELRLKLLSPGSNEWQSRIDLSDPAKLLSPYMPVTMLALLWHPAPQRVHVLGLGGGRIPVFLRKHFPNLVIDCTEIDVEVYKVAQEFFAFRSDEKLQVAICDGRQFLESRTRNDPYDFILLDAFVGVGFSPLRLGTREFLATCKSQLRPEGTLVVNLLPAGGLIRERLATIARVFRSVYVYQGEGSLVIFANDAGQLRPADLLYAARLTALRHHFDFSFDSLAARLTYVSRDELLPSAAAPTILTDATSPEVAAIPAELISATGRNDPCPCGSGRKFKKCHGR